MFFFFFLSFNAYILPNSHMICFPTLHLCCHKRAQHHQISKIASPLLSYGGKSFSKDFIWISAWNLDSNSFLSYGGKSFLSYGWIYQALEMMLLSTFSQLWFLFLIFSVVAYIACFSFVEWIFHIYLEKILRGGTVQMGVVNVKVVKDGEED